MADPAESRPDTLRPLLIVLAIIAGYKGLREIVALFLPIPNGFHDVVLVQSFLTGPRLIGLAAIAWYSRRTWTGVELGFHWRGTRVAIALLLWEIGIWFGLGFYVFHQEWFWSDIPVVIGINGVVGIFEELTYRGALLCSLKKRFGSATAVWGTATIFTLYHYGAQPSYIWPGIFLNGLLYAKLRLKGVSIYWLMVVHGLYDALVADLSYRDWIFASLEPGIIILLLWYWNKPVFPTQNPPPSGKLPAQA